MPLYARGIDGMERTQKRVRKTSRREGLERQPPASVPNAFFPSLSSTGIGQFHSHAEFKFRHPFGSVYWLFPEPTNLHFVYEHTRTSPLGERRRLNIIQKHHTRPLFSPLNHHCQLSVLHWFLKFTVLRLFQHN